MNSACICLCLMPGRRAIFSVQGSGIPKTNILVMRSGDAFIRSADDIDRRVAT